MINREALENRFFLVVVALDQRLSGYVVAAGDVGRIELDVIGAARCGMNTSPAHALDDERIGNVDLEHVVQPHRCIFHGLGLRDGSRKSVEEVTVRAVRLF